MNIDELEAAARETVEHGGPFGKCILVDGAQLVALCAVARAAKDKSHMNHSSYFMALGDTLRALDDTP